MRIHVTCAGKGQWLAIMLSLTLVTLLIHSSTSTVAPSSESVIVSHSEASVCGKEKSAVISCYFDADPMNIAKGIKTVQYNYHTYATASSCEIPKAREGKNATLICLFDNDLRNTKQGVKVVHYNSKMFDKTVFACLWHYGQADCIAQYGFRLYGEISNELHLNIPRVTKEHAGTYACIVFDSEPGTHDKCVLTVVDMVSHCEVPEVREGDNATLTCHFNNDLRNTKQGVKVVLHNQQAIDKTVLACLWHFDEPNCIEKYGFKLHGEISNELRLNIPSVTKEHAGTYACIVFDSEPERQDKCVLTVVDSSATKTLNDGCGGSALDYEREMFPLLLPVLKTACVLATVIIIVLVAIILDHVYRKYVSIASATEKK